MSAVHSQGSSFLPEAIVFNILIRLPVKSICRFKCVCKTWLSIISDRPFVDSHAAHSKSQPKLLVAIYRKESRFLFIGNLTPEQDKEGSSQVVLSQSVTMPVKYCWSFGCLQISPGDSQSVEGLMFSICSRDLIRIANPSTNRCVALRNYFPLLQDRAHRYVSLGFDPVESKHKFLESLSIFGRSVGSKVEKTLHRVVTVGDDQICWRHIKDGPTINRGGRGGHEICVNGVMYFTAWVTWSSKGIDEWEECIIVFDVRKESFQVVKLPTKKRFHYSVYPWMYMEFEGKVAIVDYPLRDRPYYDSYQLENALELWVLEDFQKHVWSLKFFNLPTLSTMMMDNPFRPKRKLVGTTLDGDLAFAVFERRIYGIDENLNETTEEKGVPISFHFFNMKTGDYRKSEVCFPEGFVLTDNVRITVMGHVEKLLSISNESKSDEFLADYAKTLALLSRVKV